MGIKIYNRDILIETAILFSLFYLPAYLFQNTVGDPSAFNDPLFNMQLWAAYVPQISLVLYIIYKNGHKGFSHFGIKKLTLNNIPLIALTIMGTAIVVGLIQSIFLLLPESNMADKVFQWDFHNKDAIPFIFVTAILTGYSEELFFRSYLYTRFEELKLGKVHLIITVNLIFALGHFYEGYQGGLNAFVLGSFFSIVFLWKRNIHVLAIAHGVYNFSVLMASLLL